jgi:hypothetical protein
MASFSRLREREVGKGVYEGCSYYNMCINNSIQKQLIYTKKGKQFSNLQACSFLPKPNSNTNQHFAISSTSKIRERERERETICCQASPAA